jgi:lysophospholipase L1-like esterase
LKKWRLATLLLLGGLLIFLALAYRYLQYARPVGSGPAGPPVPLEPFTEVWSQRKVLLLGVGDSVTAGFGARRTHGYFALLAQNPEDECPEMEGRCLSAVFPNLATQNIAVSGSTSLEHVKHLEERLQTQPADVWGIVVMTSGGNDLIHDYGRSPPREDAMYGATLEQARPCIEDYRTRLNRILDLLNERFPGGCDVFLADIYDPTDGAGDAGNAGLPPWPDGVRILAEYNAVIHQAASDRENVHVVPMHETFLGHGIHCTNWWRNTYCEEDPHYWYAFNLEDPNERGYDALRRIFLIEMAAASDRFRDNTNDGSTP